MKEKDEPLNWEDYKLMEFTQNVSFLEGIYTVQEILCAYTRVSFFTTPMQLQ